MALFQKSSLVSKKKPVTTNSLDYLATNLAQKQAEKQTAATPSIAPQVVKPAIEQVKAPTAIAPPAAMAPDVTEAVKTTKDVIPATTQKYEKPALDAAMSALKGENIAKLDAATKYKNKDNGPIKEGSLDQSLIESFGPGDSFNGNALVNVPDTSKFGVDLKKPIDVGNAAPKADVPVGTQYGEEKEDAPVKATQESMDAILNEAILKLIQGGVPGSEEERAAMKQSLDEANARNLLSVRARSGLAGGGLTGSAAALEGAERRRGAAETTSQLSALDRSNRNEELARLQAGIGAANSQQQLGINQQEADNSNTAFQVALAQLELELGRDLDGNNVIGKTVDENAAGSGNGQTSPTVQTWTAEAYPTMSEQQRRDSIPSDFDDLEWARALAPNGELTDVNGDGDVTDADIQWWTQYGASQRQMFIEGQYTDRNGIARRPPWVEQ